MESRKAEFEQTLARIRKEAPQPNKEQEEYPADPFSDAVGREYGGAIDKMDKRGF